MLFNNLVKSSIIIAISLLLRPEQVQAGNKVKFLVSGSAKEYSLDYDYIKQLPNSKLFAMAELYFNHGDEDLKESPKLDYFLTVKRGKVFVALPKVDRHAFKRIVTWVKKRTIRHISERHLKSTLAEAKKLELEPLVSELRSELQAARSLNEKIAGVPRVIVINSHYADYIY